MHNTSKRTFIALKIIAGREIRDCMVHLRKSLEGERITWVNPAGMHITMTFLGETSPGQVEITGNILESFVPLYPAPVMRVHDLGAFPDIRNPRVIWLGMDPIPSVDALKMQIDKELEENGFEIDKREFRPHLTLGRIKRLKNKALLAELVQEYAGRFFQEGVVDQLILFESILRPQGPEYIPLRKVRFKYGGP